VSEGTAQTLNLRPGKDWGKILKVERPETGGGGGDLRRGRRTGKQALGLVVWLQ
jgi:hypothetical protein